MGNVANEGKRLMDPSNMLVGLRVLVADDETFSLSIVARMLREMGCSDVVSVDSGPGCLSQFRHDKPPGINLAVLDFNMPDVNGLQVLKAIRTGQAGVPRDLPVVMLTGTADGGLVTAAVALDVDAFVVKPVSKAMLATRLQKALGDQRPTKTAVSYDSVEIDVISRALLLSHKPVGAVKTRPVERSDVPYGMKLRLEIVPVGAVLAEDVRGPDGELLLGRGATLSERFLRRLRDMAGVARIEYLLIEQPKKNGAS
jgi:CheY-like chemotaxis protein